MREWWANVYEPGCYMTDRGTHIARHKTRDMAIEGCTLGSGERTPGLRGRIHVRLKPEGAPRRYASPENRAAWEQDAKACRKTMRTFRISAESIRPD